MVYDGVLMRSIVALALAGLILAAHAPGLFVETPVCAAVDGARAAVVASAGDPTPARNSFFLWKKKRRPKNPSCCGTSACPMHAQGCGETATCSMDAAYGPDPMIASADRASHRRIQVASSETRLCSPACGREGSKMTPGAPDPGTFELNGRPAPSLAQSHCSHAAPRGAPAGCADPAVPPPRS
jgi:hypothetical protein